MDLNDRIQFELNQSKHSERYCVYLLAKKRRIAQYYKIATLLFSTAGILGWSVWDKAPLILTIILAFVSLVKLISPHIIPSEKEINDIDIVRDFYVDYFNKLEFLFLDFFNYKIEDDEAQKIFYEIKNSERNINTLIDKYVKSQDKKLKIKADKDTLSYMNKLLNW